MAIQTAAKLYQDNLWSSPEALNYLVKTRGLTEDIIREYQIGYATGHILSGTGSSKMEDIGLVDGGQDFFEGYLTFPVVDNGVYINMYGRSMVDAFVPHKTLPGIPKNCLYNSEALNRKGAVIVESPIDCLTLIQNKLNSCAIMGTKLSDDSVNKFAGVACYILFDRDPSGKLGASSLAAKIFSVAAKVCIMDFPGKKITKMDANLYFMETGNATDRIKFLVKNSVPLKTAPFGFNNNKAKIKKEKTPEDFVPIAEVGRILFKDEHHVDKGDEIWVRCPHHKEGKENNRSLWIGGRKNIWYCFGCLKGGGPVYLVTWHLQVSFQAGREWISSRFPVGQ